MIVDSELQIPPATGIHDSHSGYRSMLVPTISRLAIDRLSGDELIRRGYARHIPAQRPFEPIPAEIPGIIYAIQAPPVLAVKIGFTRAAELEHRVRALQTANPYPLKVIAKATGLAEHERAIHKKLAAHRLTGEWFDWAPPVAALVESLKLGIEAAIQEPPHE